MIYSWQLFAGTLLLVGLAQFIVLLQISQDLYPNYSTSKNYISDLGATCKFPSGACTVVQASAFIFNGSSIVLGILVVISAYCLQRAFGQKMLSLFVILGGFGVMGVGLFPETAGIIHLIVAFLSFIFLGLAALVSYRILQSPLNYISIVLGGLTLINLILFATGNNLVLGVGGMERMIVYPVMIWGLLFAGYLIKRFHEDISSG